MNLETTAVPANRLDDRSIFFLRIETGETYATSLRRMRSGHFVAGAVLKLDINVTNSGSNRVIHIRFEAARRINLAWTRAFVFGGDNQFERVCDDNRHAGVDGRICGVRALE